MWTFRVLHLPFLREDILIALEICWVIAMALGAIGLLTRLATAASFCLAFYLLALGNNFGKVGHGDQAMVLTMLILALSRCGDAWSVDALIARRRSDAPPRARPPLPGEYRWPIRMVWLLLSIVFCAAGASKLVRCGFAWITSDHLALTLIQAHYFHNKPPTDIGRYVARFRYYAT